MFERWKVTRTAIGAAAKLVLAQLRGPGDEGDDSTAEPVDDAAFLQQLGVAARPVIAASLRALGWRYGDEVWLFKLWDKTKTPTDLEEGETRIYGAGEPTARARFRASGAINVDAKSGQDVTLTGAKTVIQGGVGEQKAARKNDPVHAGSIQFRTSSSPMGNLDLYVQYKKADGTLVGSEQKLTLGADLTVTLAMPNGRIDAGSPECLIGGTAS